MLLAIILLSLFYTACESAKILYVMPFTAASHYISQKDLALGLAQRGHDVYVITAFKEEIHPQTYHQIMVDHKSIWDSLFDEKPNIFDTLEMSFITFQDFTFSMGYFTTELVFNSTEVQKFLREDHKFDLVINELFFQESLYLLAHKYQAPLVLVTTFGNSLRGNYYSRNPLQLSTTYHEYAGSPDPLSFTGRLYNWYYCMCNILMTKFIYLPRQEELVKKFYRDLPEPIPSLEEMAANASLVLMNSHFSTDTPTAYLPNFIEVGGLNHVKNSTSLPKDLQEILDNSKQGVVFLSFGSNVQSCELNKDRLDAFFKVFGELKQTVLMKWEDKEPSGVPKNVILRKWFPQKDVVAHPNVKLFIGHGGLLGLQETIAAGVPILGIPVFGDQYLNILQTVQNGHGEMLEYKDINEMSLRTVVMKMLSDERYSLKAKEISKRFKDRPMSGLDTAMWWIEYVIRHKGAEFMKSPALKLSFIAYHMLDVYAFVFIVIISTFCLICKVLKSKLTRKSNNKQKCN